MAGILNWIDTLFFGVRRLYAAGTELPERPAINFAGPGVTATDDPANNRTTVTVAPGDMVFYYYKTADDALASDDTREIVISGPFGSSNATLVSVHFIPSGLLSAHATNYAELDLSVRDIDEGVVVRGAAMGRTIPSGTYATGGWGGFTPVPLTDLTSGSPFGPREALSFRITKGGSGVPVPAGTLVVVCRPAAA
ncbi:hypothetical protein WME90_02025 [Sorangium sp. So ce375]|uniref:hypothetical protein n=1 Tax=Sorangium sp. So ce375 TaxID=3133306 RepID=UPI003F5B8A34